MIVAAIPTPSPHFQTHQSIDAVFTWVTLAAVLAAAAYASRSALRRRSAVPVLILVGGFAAALLEPMVSTIGMVQYPIKKDQWTGIEAFGQPIPVFVVLAYALEVGVGALIVWSLLLRDPSGRAVVRAWVSIMVFDLVFESVGIWLKVFRYYGHQPFDFWGMPLWWLPIDASICLLPGIAAYALTTWGGRWYAHAALVVSFPMSAAIMYMAPGWPVFLLLNTSLPAALVWSSGVPAVLVSVAMVFGLVRIADRLDPVRRALSDPEVGSRPADAPMRPPAVVGRR